jgi:nucleotide-binding universal stress UspA family protein
VKILVCIDGSEQADRAVRMAAELATACQAEVTLLGIQETAGNSDLILGALRRGQQLLETHKIAAELISKSGDPIEEIIRRTEQVSYELVVIGAVRKGYRGPFSMAAKVYRIIKLIRPPVLVVVGNPTGLKRILICSGGKRYIESAFELVGQIAQKTAASVTLLHVMPQPPAIYSEIGKLKLDVNQVLSSNSELGRNLRREKQTLAALGIETEVRLRQGFVLDEIFQEIRGGHYDLVVTGSSLSAGPLRTYVLGDVTREIVNRAECPVLVARHVQQPPNLKEKLKDLLRGFSLSGAPSAGTEARQP